MYLGTSHLLPTGGVGGGGGSYILLWDGGTNVCSNGPDHMTKVAAMPIYDKNIKKKIFFGTKRPMTLNLGMHHWMLEY